MSKAGQNNFTGISAQADITLLYLLQSYKRDDFQQLVIEGDKWEDFTLIFDEYDIDFEVKWHNKPISYSLIKSIIDKELQKQYGEKFLFKIITKNMSDQFRADYEYIKDPFVWNFKLRREEFKDNEVVKKFLQKNWSEEAIFFLSKTEIIELTSDRYVTDRILEYFTLDEPFYLSPDDQESIVARSFKKILERGAKGEAITRQKFLETVEKFKNSIAEKSESFSPDISIKNKIVNLTPFLSSEQEFKKLDQSKYLSPISSNSRIIFFIANKIEKNNFDVSNIDFFIKKILLKKHYINLTLHLLSKKWEQKKIDAAYLLKFLANNYKNLFYEFYYDKALRLIYEIAKEDDKKTYTKNIINFFKKEQIIKPFGVVSDSSERLRQEWDEKDAVANILEISFSRTNNQKDFIDFIFEYFDFTNDEYENVITTHPKIYTIVKEFILENLESNFFYIVEKIAVQFDIIYVGRYKGFEWIGSGIGRSGSNFSISDIGVVRLLFKPLFEEIYSKDPKSAWNFFKNNILNKAKKQCTKKNPVFLKRALISILFKRISDIKLDNKFKEEAFDYLVNILKMKRGIPNTSEIIFDELRRLDFSDIGYDRVIKLIEFDSIKYISKKFNSSSPTNLFAITALIQLVKYNYEAGKNYFIKILKNPEILRNESRYDPFELLSIHGIPENNPDFM
ncbi:MAG: hypothetical protein GF353_13170, partial [Candidatus Lokiarchaeota archaeon]|nr:hypothetical protein [Candidatus Lokiarchaeota archaeon]